MSREATACFACKKPGAAKRCRCCRLRFCDKRCSSASWDHDRHGRLVAPPAAHVGGEADAAERALAELGRAVELYRARDASKAFLHDMPELGLTMSASAGPTPNPRVEHADQASRAKYDVPSFMPSAGDLATEYRELEKETLGYYVARVDGRRIELRSISSGDVARAVYLGGRWLPSRIRGTKAAPLEWGHARDEKLA